MTFWDTLEKALVSGNRLVRAQSNYAYCTIFGWLLVDSISESDYVESFLNPVSKKELGCDGWSDEKYIKEWCGGERDTIVRRIRFTYIPYANIPDYQYSYASVKTAVDQTSKTRIRHHLESIPGQLKFAVDLQYPPFHVNKSNFPNAGDSKIESAVESLISSIDTSLRALQKSATDTRTKSLTEPSHDTVTKDKLIMDLQKRILEQELGAHKMVLEMKQKELDAQTKALDKQQKELEREQAQVQDSLLRERNERIREQKFIDEVRANALAKDNMQQCLAVEASRQEFFLKLMNNSHFASLSNNPVLQQVAMAMVVPSLPVAPVPQGSMTPTSPSIADSSNLKLQLAIIK